MYLLQNYALLSVNDFHNYFSYWFGKHIFHRKNGIIVCCNLLTFVAIYLQQKKCLKNPHQKIEKLASQNFLFFFGRETLIFHYGLKYSIFQKYFRNFKIGHL
jgi:hypothetical protein